MNDFPTTLSKRPVWRLQWEVIDTPVGQWGLRMNIKLHTKIAHVWRQR